MTTRKDNASRKPEPAQPAISAADEAPPAVRQSRGQVDAPGKAHRKAPAPMHGVKHSNLMIPKVKAAQTMRRPQRRG